MSTTSAQIRCLPRFTILQCPTTEHARSHLVPVGGNRVPRGQGHHMGQGIITRAVMFALVACLYLCATARAAERPPPTDAYDNSPPPNLTETVESEHFVVHYTS